MRRSVSVVSVKPEKNQYYNLGCRSLPNLLESTDDVAESARNGRDKGLIGSIEAANAMVKAANVVHDRQGMHRRRLRNRNGAR